MSTRIVSVDQMEDLGIYNARDGERYVLRELSIEEDTCALYLENIPNGIKMPNKSVSSELLESLNLNDGMIMLVVKDDDYYWQK